MFLKVGALVRSHGVGLGQDGDDVDFIVKPLHKFNVERFQAVARRLDEVQAHVDAIVADRLALNARFSVQIFLVLGFNVVDDRLPTANQKKKKTEEKLS